MLAAVAALTLTACGQEHDDYRGKGDAPVAGHHGEDSPANVTNFPDGYSNIATKCVDGAPGWRVIITTHADHAPPAMAVVQDASCV